MDKKDPADRFMGEMVSKSLNDWMDTGHELASLMDRVMPDSEIGLEILSNLLAKSPALRKACSDLVEVPLPPMPPAEDFVGLPVIDPDFLSKVPPFYDEENAVKYHEELHRRFHELSKPDPKPRLFNLCGGPRKPKP